MSEQPHFSPGDEAYIDEAVRSGRFASRDEVVLEGLRALREREERVTAIRRGVERGIADADAGRLIDIDEAFDRIDAMLDEMEAAKAR